MSVSGSADALDRAARLGRRVRGDETGAAEPGEDLDVVRQGRDMADFVAGTASRAPASAGSDMELLLTCTRRYLHGGYERQADELVAATTDWRAFLQAAAMHGMQNVVFSALSPRWTATVPAGVEAALKTSYRNAAAHNLLLTTELGSVLAAFQDAGIDAIPFKGPMLAHRSYRSLAVRPSGDLDVLISAERFADAEDALLRLDYSRSLKEAKRASLVDRINLRLSKQCTFGRNRTFWIDLHVAIMPPGYTYAPAFESLWKRSVPVDMCGFSTRSFSDEDLLIILCLHGMKNRWELLKHWCDIAAHMTAFPSIDWDWVDRLCGEMRCRRIVSLGLYLVRELLDVPLPPNVSARVDAAPAICALGDRLVERIETGNGAMLDAATRRRLYLQTQSDLTGKARYILYSLGRHLADRTTFST